MNPMQYRNSYLPRGRAGGPDEAEMLQTDVMRFIAILGLCLMAVFALVQSLPATPPDPRPKIAEAEKARENLNNVTHALNLATEELREREMNLAR